MHIIFVERRVLVLHLLSSGIFASFEILSSVVGRIERLRDWAIYIKSKARI